MCTKKSFSQNEPCKLCNKVSLHNGYCGSCKPYLCCDCKKMCGISSIRFAGDIKCDECHAINGVTCKESHDKCLLDNKCCFCEDKRYYSDYYDGYIDSVGYVKNKKRWEFYCETCMVRFASIK